MPSYQGYPFVHLVYKMLDKYMSNTLLITNEPTPGPLLVQANVLMSFDICTGHVTQVYLYRSRDICT